MAACITFFELAALCAQRVDQILLLGTQRLGAISKK
jgi:hypothetical protein